MPDPEKTREQEAEEFETTGISSELDTNLPSAPAELDVDTHTAENDRELDYRHPDGESSCDKSTPSECDKFKLPEYAHDAEHEPDEGNTPDYMHPNGKPSK